MGAPNTRSIFVVSLAARSGDSPVYLPGNAENMRLYQVNRTSPAPGRTGSGGKSLFIDNSMFYNVSSAIFTSKLGAVVRLLCDFLIDSGDMILTQAVCGEKWKVFFTWFQLYGYEAPPVIENIKKRA